MKKKIKGHLKNITENTVIEIDTFAVINKNKIDYTLDTVKTRLITSDKELIILRENEEFRHSMTFRENKEIVSTYSLLENGLNLEIPVETKELVLEHNYIKLTYLIPDTLNFYEYEVKVIDNEY